MAATAILDFGKMSITLDWIKIILHQIIWEDAPRRRGDDRVTKSRNRKLIRVTSSTECSKFTWLENPRWWGRHLGFRKISITPNCIELFAQNLVGRCITAMRRQHTTKTRNRNFFCVTALLWWIKMHILHERRKHNRCADVDKSSQLPDL